MLSLKGFARELAEDVKNLGLVSEVIDLKDYDPDDRLSDEVRFSYLSVCECARKLVICLSPGKSLCKSQVHLLNVKALERSYILNMGQ